MRKNNVNRWVARRSVWAVLAVAGLLLSGGIARGQAGAEAPPPAMMPAKGPPVRVITTSLASLANLEALAKEVGGDLPTWLTADGLGEMFPFLGKGSIDPDKPVALGVFLFGGDMATEVASGKGIVIVLPLNADKGKVEDLKKFGMVEMAEHPGVVQAQGLSMRRTGGYLMFGPTLENVLSITDAELLEPYGNAAAGVTPLAWLKVDGTALRKNFPDQYESVFKQWKEAAGPAKNAREELGRDIALDFFRGLDRIEMRLNRRGGDLECSIAMAPVQVAVAGNFPKPGLPADIIGRMDLGISAGKGLPAFNKMVEQAVATMGDEIKDAQQRKVTVEAFGQAAEFFASGQAMSLGVHVDGEKSVGYIVQQMDKPVDAAGRLQALSDEITKVSGVLDDPSGREKTTTTIEHYPGKGGLGITRMNFLSNADTKFAIEAASEGNNLLIAISGDGQKHLDALIGLPAEGRITEVLSGWIDIPETLTALSQVNGADAALPENVVKDLVAQCKGQKSTFTVKGEKDAITLTYTLPVGVLKVMGASQAKPVEGKVEVQP